MFASKTPLHFCKMLLLQNTSVSRESDKIGSNAAHVKNTKNANLPRVEHSVSIHKKLALIDQTTRGGRGGRNATISATFSLTPVMYNSVVFSSSDVSSRTFALSFLEPFCQ